MTLRTGEVGPTDVAVRNDEPGKTVDSTWPPQKVILKDGPAEIVAAVPPGGKGSPSDTLTINVLEMARRRPLKAADLSSALNMSLEEVESLIKGLLIKGHLRRQEYSGEIYYLHP